jgi:hypothetical protein
MLLSPTLGADINAAVTGVKGYIQDFFWTEDAISFTQADLLLLLLNQSHFIVVIHL